MYKLMGVLLLSIMLLFGCVGGEQEYITEEETAPLEGEETVPVGGEEPIGLGCEPSYEFSELPAQGMIGTPVQFSVISTCAEGKVIGLNIDNRQETGGTIASNEPTTFNFILLPEVEGTKQLVVWSDYDVVYNESWEVLPIGSSDISGNKNDPVSVKEWVATAFEIEGPLTVKSVGAYMRRLYSQTLEGSEVRAEIRMDDGGNPSGNYIAVSSLPVTDTTMTENWIYFNYPEGVELSAGKYWVVFRVTQENEEQIVSDVVNLHYTFGGDTTVPGDEYTRRMTLEWDNSKREYIETSWEPRAYERTYSVIISGKEQ
jgi:hypothetical protein